MSLTEEQKTEVCELARLPGMTAKEIAIVTGILPTLFLQELQNEGSDIYMAYHKGRLMTKAELGKKIKTLSDQGSGPAQTLMLKMMQKQEYDTLLELYENNKDE